MNVPFIAEVSSNHAQDLQRSFDFIDRSAEVGCAVVKFQLFKVESLFSPEALKSKPDLLKRKAWELPLDFLPRLADRCKSRGVAFSCTPFYLEAVAELAPYVDFYKVASYELMWDDLLAACAATGKGVVLSTGMATMEEIVHATDVLKKNGCAAPTLLHCTSAYPTPYQEANLAAIETLRQATGCAVGWSDHTVQPGVIHRAVHRYGASMVEFHIDLDGQGDEYAAGHCWLPDQIGAVIRDLSIGFGAEGDGVKAPVASELPDRLWRADPSDGLRPLLEMRARLQAA
ncbi:N-acetylneuraminate synthase family protein [Roseateles asaccharophilus]|uniref:N-acetylneuraminate synthase n=1 Tax=Roseateles asaccharophilus TaxID=582607 RepID=A0ABU2A9Z8_9BURK|nr:N-acetylneuraminate synthase family protein [Roseateles asaccharophilus]MDR7333940.1 N-acetylneuraminate synthase [Roseateles asaccharophilus]